jgi:hypothetical protein
MSTKKSRSINTSQLAALRHALAREEGEIEADGSTCNALRDRGYAAEAWDFDGNCFVITREGRERARLKADVKVERDGVPFDPSLMKDLE